MATSFFVAYLSGDNHLSTANSLNKRIHRLRRPAKTVISMSSKSVYSKNRLEASCRESWNRRFSSSAFVRVKRIAAVI